MRHPEKRIAGETDVYKVKTGFVIHVIAKNLNAEETECLWRGRKHRVWKGS